MRSAASMPHESMTTTEVTTAYVPTTPNATTSAPLVTKQALLDDAKVSLDACTQALSISAARVEVNSAEPVEGPKVYLAVGKAAHKRESQFKDSNNMFCP